LAGWDAFIPSCGNDPVPHVSGENLNRPGFEFVRAAGQHIVIIAHVRIYTFPTGFLTDVDGFPTGFLLVFLFPTCLYEVA